MNERRPPLTPYPLEVLLGRIAQEWESRHRIFDLPTGRFHRPEPVHDLSVETGGRRAGTPVGPAAGPHTQLAQNFVLGWLAGGRVFECKTIQVLDHLQIDRPCMDMEAEGYNVEWSQELTLGQSLEEYVKAWMLLEILRGWEALRPVVGRPTGHVFDMSVGYDLAGISSESVDEFIRGMRDATPVIDVLRHHIPPPFERFREHPFEPRLITAATLSTFHGCPPDEIEGIVRRLIDVHDLDVVVKLNPTLLGFEEVEGILHDLLGYDSVALDPAAFETDLRFDEALELIAGLDRYAHARGRRFGVKLTNTLVVRNVRNRLEGEAVYLSGPPLHVISMTLLDRLVAALPGTFDLGVAGGPVQVSWSGGIDPGNVAEAVGLGLRPVTVCSDLLKPGGYGHLAGMIKKLDEELTNVAAKDLREWVVHQEAVAREAGFRDAVASYAARLHTPAGAAPYTKERVTRRLRAVDHVLERWGCVACNLCVTVCPNDAMLHLPTPESLAGELPDKWQYFCLAELCNECGNCTTFCPEKGEPFLVKPRLFLDRSRFVADGGPSFLVRGTDGAFSVEAASGYETDSQRLETILGAEEGLPLRPGDLVAVG